MKVSKTVKGLIMICLIASAMLLMGCGKGDVSIIDDENCCLYAYGVVFNSKGEILFDDEQLTSVANSLDQATMAFTDVQGNFYVTDGKKLVLVADNVQKYVVANYGDGVAYWNGSTLYLYNVAKEKTTTIAESVTENFCISPDGKSVAYQDEKYGDLYLSQNGKTGKKLYEENYPIAISNDGKKVFHLGYKGLYLNGKAIEECNHNLVMNADHTEALFMAGSTGNSQVYFVTEKGKVVKQKKVEEFEIYPIEGYLVSVPLGNGMGESVPVTTFDGLITRLNDNVGRISIKGRKAEITKKYTESVKYNPAIFISKTGTEAIFVSQENSEISYIKNSDKSMKVKVMVEGDDSSDQELRISKIAASEDLEKVYYVANGDLYYLNGKKSVRLARELESILPYEAMIAYSDKYEMIYFVLEGSLYCAETKESSIEKLTEDLNVTKLISFGGNVFFAVENEDREMEMYMAKKKKTEKIFTEKDFSK